MNLRRALPGVYCATLLLTLATGLRAQGTRDDYDRARQLPGLMRGKVFRDRVEPHWFAANTRFWYRNDLAGGAREFVLVDAVGGGRQPAFDHQRLAAALFKSLGKEVRSERLPFDTITFDDGCTRLSFSIEGKRWQAELATYELRELGKGEEPMTSLPAQPKSKPKLPPRRGAPSSPDSSDGKWTAFIKDHNVCLRDRKSGAELAVSKDGSAEDAYGGPFWWSPDAQKLVVQRTRRAEERKAYVVESSPKGQVVPRLHSFDYRRPGDPIPVSKPHLFDVSERREVPISDTLFPTPWDITQLRWDADSSRFTFLYNQRGHRVLRVVAVDASTGAARAIVDEQSKTFIDYNGKLFMHYLSATGELIWMSERDGWNHLYLYDARTGKVKHQITCGDWLVRGVDRVDAEKRQIWFRAGGIHPAQDPYHIHFARVNFDGSGLVLLTEGDGTHTLDYSPDGRFLVDTYSRVDLPPVTELRRGEDGKLVCALERADVDALLKTGWQPPERFVAKGRDGKTDIHGVIFRPTNFDPRKRYPVIEEIYAGPQGAFVPKRFSAYYSPQALAELGFIVVKIDGMGTAHRSKAFHDVCWKNLGDAGLPDRVLWIKAAAARYRWMDLERVGIYGTSAGGQSALGALLSHPGFYKVAVAVCGCHDNMVDKIWWNELWMGWPIGPHYREQSNVTNAHKLEGKLLLVVGELDRNVDPASTMQVVNALVKSDKDFDLLVIPGGGHSLGGSYGVRRLQDFFVRNLLQHEPRAAAKQR
jgi:dipeptidyl aminopeptidase/acylaminoacyl peptidase